MSKYRVQLWDGISAQVLSSPNPAKGAKPADAQIAIRVVTALDWNPSVPQGRVKVGVTEDSVVLEGTVNHQCEKVAAERVVRRVVGPRAVTNLIVVRPMAKAMPPLEEIKA
jgi:osmotically-inducible protein OsmY